MLYEKKKAVLSKALKGKATPVKVVNKVEIAEKPMPEMKPTLRLSTDNIPEIKNWKVGGEYKIILTVKQKSMRQGNEFEYGEPGENKEIYATFEINDAKAV